LADYEIPEDLLYSEDDEWIRVDDDRIVIGVTDYAQQQLGDIVFVELPEIGSNLEQGEAFGVIESVKAVSDLLAPIGGEVLEVNTILAEAPESVNEDCYGEGWIVVVARENEDEIEALLDPSAYRKHVEQRSS
jgi:glycine cleavage system H protein